MQLLVVGLEVKHWVRVVQTVFSPKSKITFHTGKMRSLAIFPGLWNWPLILVSVNALKTTLPQMFSVALEESLNYRTLSW